MTSLNPFTVCLLFVARIRLNYSVCSGWITSELVEERAASHFSDGDIEHGWAIYENGFLCHRREGRDAPGRIDSQIVARLRRVVVKQLADIQATNRDNYLVRASS